VIDPYGDEYFVNFDKNTTAVVLWDFRQVNFDDSGYRITDSFYRNPRMHPFLDLRNGLATKSLDPDSASQNEQYTFKTEFSIM
jgi:hypothetical protein